MLHKAGYKAGKCGAAQFEDDTYGVSPLVGKYSGRAGRPSHRLRGLWFERAIGKYFQIYHLVIEKYGTFIGVFNPDHWLSSVANHSISESLIPSINAS
jgi:hypothetical protein